MNLNISMVFIFRKVWRKEKWQADMNQKIFSLWVNCKPPFHQKVVRSNYEIPESLLKKCVEIALEDRAALQCCDDYLEVSYQVVGSAQSISKQDLLTHFIQLAQKPRGTALGIFDESLSFYLRVFLAPKEEFAPGAEACGGFEFFGGEERMRQVHRIFCNTIDAHFIIEGAKTYLDEISEV